uniref:C-type lectin domain-containing protein n=1 Tax=Cyprinodon variegatus TaxID=28743 RepID=A0A3Q2CJS8_CYPVA
DGKRNVFKLGNKVQWISFNFFWKTLTCMAENLHQHKTHLLFVLHFKSWRWSDGQRLKMTSFSKWNQSQSVTVENSCVTTTSSVWNIRPCSSTYPFICRGELNKFDWDRGHCSESSVLKIQSKP